VREWNFTATDLFWQAALCWASSAERLLRRRRVCHRQGARQPAQAAIDEGTAAPSSPSTSPAISTPTSPPASSASRSPASRSAWRASPMWPPSCSRSVQAGRHERGRIKGVSIGIAYAIVTYLHVVLGEQTPKVLAIRKSLATTLVIARPLHSLLRPAEAGDLLLNGAPTRAEGLSSIIDPVSEHESPIRKRNCGTSWPRARSPRR
jgi:hypothetical protein